MRTQLGGWTALAAGCGISVAIASVVTRHVMTEPVSTLDLVSAACQTMNPLYAVSRSSSRQWSLDERITLFHDTVLPDDFGGMTEQIAGVASLAKESDVGSVYGLGYDWRRHHLYVSAHYSLGSDMKALPVGPSGLGGIYRVDLAQGSVQPWTALAAGTLPSEDADVDSLLKAIGTIGIGDIDVTEDSSELFVANQGDQHIYRLSLPDGQIRGTIPNGAKSEAWSSEARLFGLGIHANQLYHGLTNRSKDIFVYRSNLDGTNMSSIVKFNIADLDLKRRNKSSTFVVSDIAIRDPQNLTIGLRGDRADWQGFDTGGHLVSLSWDARFNAFVAKGGVFADDDPRILGSKIPQPEDDPGSTGSMALGPCRRTLVTPQQLCGLSCGGALWLDSDSGKPFGPGNNYEWLYADSGGLGDIELLCRPYCSAYLPGVQRASCTRPRPIDLVMLFDMSTSMTNTIDNSTTKYEVALQAGTELAARLLGDTQNNRVSVLGFNASVWVEQALSSDSAAVSAAVRRLPSRISEGTRLDLALLGALNSLAIQRPEAQPVVLLLSDGKPNRVPPAADGKPETTVLEAAARVKSAVTELMVVGFGQSGDLDEVLLERVATSPGDYYFASTGASLIESFRKIQGQLVCP